MKHDENILVVPRSKLFTDPTAPQGFLKLENFDDVQQKIEASKEFLPRSFMELDPSYKQIIPYLIFMHEEKLFLMQRAGSAGEQRLKNKYTLGIGGHIRERDIAGATMFDWATREFHEEVAYQGNLDIRPLGLINDETNAVGQVHLGFAFLLLGDSPDIAIKSELAQGALYSLEQCKQFFEHMETWSQIAFAYLEQEFFKERA
jgi:predicted NUDIX family phosphoesterase